MASVEQVRQAILRVAGNPDSGPIRDLADDMARAVVELDDPAHQADKEKRVLGPTEVR
jgi:hypothetical protein